MKGSKRGRNGRRMLGDSEDSFPLLPFSPQRGHLYRVRLIIPYPQTWRADAVTLKACVCMCGSRTRVCVCVTLFGCAFLILQPSICMCVRMAMLFLPPCVSLRVRVRSPLCLCVCAAERRRQHGCTRVGIYDTFHLFTAVPPAVSGSPCGNQASLMLLISDMSQTVCSAGVEEGGETNGGGVGVRIWEGQRDGDWERWP